MTRLMIEIGVALAAVLAFVLYERHAGAAACVAGNAIAISKQEAGNAAQAADDAKTINIETQAYAQAVAAPADPTPALVCVRKYAAPRTLPSTAAAAPGGDGPAALPGTDSGGASAAFDPGPRLAPIGKAANAQVALLQDYITKVCRPHP